MSLPFLRERNAPSAANLLYFFEAINCCGFLSREAESFACAFRGIVALFKSEVHARIHLVATIAVIALGWWREITRSE